MTSKVDDSIRSEIARVRIAVAIVAAGRGVRAGVDNGGPKQFRRIGGRPVLEHTIRAFADHPDIGKIAVSIHPDDRQIFSESLGELCSEVIVVDGGSTRQSSVRQTLHALEQYSPDFVLIHDGARPFVEKALIDRVLASIDTECGVLPALAVSDTLKRASPDGIVYATEPRENLYAAQTPQAFPFSAILAAHDRAENERRRDFTDDAMLAEWAEIPVRLIEGSAENVKLTWPRDIAMADQKLGAIGSNFPDIRTGNGYDVHAFTKGDTVTLCGVAIPHERGLLGHSDADVALHALTDALLATCGAGDIGTHFPPSDPYWLGAASRIFVEHASNLVRRAGGRIANVDVTLIAEAPKIGPHRRLMVTTIAEMLQIAPERVSVKATTNENLGFVGRREGIAAIATASVVFPGGVPE